MRLKAFTLVEITVGLLIGSIVILLSVMGFIQMDKLHLRFQRQTDHSASYERFHFLMAKDFAVSDKVFQMENPANFYFTFSRMQNQIEPMDTTRYQFMDSIVIRGQFNRNDTFKFSNTNIAPAMNSINKMLVEKFRVEVDGKVWTFNKEYPGNVILTDQLNQQ